MNFSEIRAINLGALRPLRPDPSPRC